MKGVDNIEFRLKSLNVEYIKEFLPIVGHQFRSDFYVPSLNLLIEFEGIVSNKSRHTTILGYSKDCEKYNLISLAGYKLLRYTTITVHNLGPDLTALVNNQVERRPIVLKKEKRK